MVMLEPNGVMIHANRAFSDWLGYHASDLLQRNWWNLLDSDELGESMAAAGRLLEGIAEVAQFDARFRSRNGSPAWGHVRMTSLGGQLLVQIVDTAQRMEVEQKVRRLNQELEQRVAELTALHQEMAAYTDSVTHDLRAPLRQVESFSRIILEDYSASLADPQARLTLERISATAAVMGRMLHALQEFSRLGRHPMATVACDLGDLATQVVSSLEPDWRCRDITWDIAPLPFADCDPDLIRLVYQNLFSNAIKFTRRQPKAQIQAGSFRKGRTDVFYVRDNGVGFPARQEGHLFGVFQRLHRQEDFEGTGVGLASVRRIVERHGGRVWAESELGQGATFYFTLTSADESLPVADEQRER